MSRPRRTGYLNPLRMVRLARLAMRRIVRRVALSRLFLVIAAVVVATSMLVFGSWIAAHLRSSISEGVAATAASSMDALIAGNFEGFDPRWPLSAEDRAKLDEIFRIGNDAQSTRLLQIRIRALDGAVIYESLGGFADREDESVFRRAAAGAVVAAVQEVEIAPVGPLGVHTLPVLNIHTPLRRAATDEIFAVAELYYSARSILRLQQQSQRQVWLHIGIAALAVIAILYLFVDYASRTIARQRADLGRNLMQSRHLSEEIARLHLQSERLRIEASLSNERLLAQVGSDLHDGPLQLLTLIILRLSKSATEVDAAPEKAALRRTADLAAEALEEVRNISTGLVLPELADLSLAEVIGLAVVRHEGATGTKVVTRIETGPAAAIMAVRICIYRVVQEALNNAYWHGDGASPVVAARVEEAACHLEIGNLIGRAETSRGARKEARRLGLRSMTFRVESLGGNLQVEQVQNQLVVRATIPLQGQSLYLSSTEKDSPLSRPDRPF